MTSARNRLTETLFIINPVSGGGASLRTWRTARPALLAAGLKLREHITNRPGEATEVTRVALAGGIRWIVAVGGDGTLSEVINGYLDANGHAVSPEAAIGMIPGGTGSDFCRTIGVRDTRAAVGSITGAITAAIAGAGAGSPVRTAIRTIDAAQITLNDRSGQGYTRGFINVATFGLGGDTAYFVNRWRGNPRLKWFKGRSMYAAAALRALDRYRNHCVRITLEGKDEIEINTNLLVVANGRYAGAGMMLAPHAQPDDGRFDIILTDGASRWDIIKELPRIGRGGHLQNPRVGERRAASVSIGGLEPLPIDVDGDFAGYTPAQLAVLPGAIRFLVPREPA